MPRYFFHLHNDIDAPDEEGTVFDDDRAALEFALENARDVASASVRAGRLNLHDRIVCVDEDGREVGVVRFANAVCVEG